MTPGEARALLGPAWRLEWCPDVPYGAHRGGWRATRPRAGGGVPWLRGSRRLELVVEMCAEADAWERAHGPAVVQLPLWEEARRAA